MLNSGGVVLLATEGVWGLTCDPLQDEALHKVFQLKQRDPAKGLILIGATPADFEPHLEGVAHASEVRDSWPGAHTWVLPNHGRFSEEVTGGRCTVACRVPGHAQARALCAAFGGLLVSTSANISGQSPVLTFTQACETFAESVDCIVKGEVLNPGKPSTIHAMDGTILRGG